MCKVKMSAFLLTCCLFLQLEVGACLGSGDWFTGERWWKG